MSSQSLGIFSNLGSMANVGQLFGAQDLGPITENLSKIQQQLSPEVFTKFLGSLGGIIGTPGELPAPGESIGRRVEAGDSYFFEKGQRSKKGRITQRRYNFSWVRPMILKGGQVLYKGILYPNVEALVQDSLDGKLDGQRRPVGIPLSKILEAVASMLNGAPQTDGCQAPESSQECEAAPSDDARRAQLEADYNKALESGSIEDLVLALMALLGDKLDDEIKELSKGIKKELDKEPEPDGKKGAAASSGGKKSGEYRDDANLQHLQTKLQSAMDRRKQLYELSTNTLKTLHDASSSIIRNFKA